MLADFWYVFDVDDLGLWIMRFLQVAFGAVVVWARFSKFDHQKRWKKVPIEVKTFTAGFFTLWWTMAIYIWITDNLLFGEWYRTIYGSLFLGTMIGFMWHAWYLGKDYDEEHDISRCALHQVLMKAVQDDPTFSAYHRSKGDVSNERVAERVGGPIT